MDGGKRLLVGLLKSVRGDSSPVALLLEAQPFALVAERRARIGLERGAEVLLARLMPGGIFLRLFFPLGFQKSEARAGEALDFGADAALLVRRKTAERLPEMFYLVVDGPGARGVGGIVDLLAVAEIVQLGDPDVEIGEALGGLVCGFRRKPQQAET